MSGAAPYMGEPRAHGRCMAQGAMAVLKVKRFEAAHIGALKAEVAAYIARQPPGAVIEQTPVSGLNEPGGRLSIIVKVWLEPAPSTSSK